MSDPSSGAARRAALFRWTAAGGWAIADRLLFSLANFLVSLLLARWLTEAEYGAFAFAIAIFLLAGTLHQGWVTEPLLVFGPARFRDRFPAYLGYVLRRHARYGAWTLLVGGLVAAAAFAVGARRSGVVLAVTAVAAPWILLQWLGRLACYASVGARRAALAGAAQLVLILAGLFLLRATGALDTVTAILLLGAAGGVTGVWLVATFRPRLRSHVELGPDVDELHRKYGIWSAGTGLLTWLPGQVYYVVLPIAGATAAAGNLRALMNLVLPLMQVYVAVGLVLTTALSRARVESAARYRKIVAWSLGLLAAGALMYEGLLWWLGPAALHWVYDGRYDALAGLLPLAGLIPLVGLGATVLAPALRARERPDQVFVAYAASTVASLTIGLWLTLARGVVGATLALVVTTAVTTAVLAAMYYRGSSSSAPAATSMSTTSYEPSE